jgi:uncharacterized protein YxeA
LTLAMGQWVSWQVVNEIFSIFVIFCMMIYATSNDSITSFAGLIKKTKEGVQVRETKDNIHTFYFTIFY